MFCPSCGKKVSEIGDCTNVDCSAYGVAGQSHIQKFRYPKAPIGRRVGGVVLERFCMWGLQAIGEATFFGGFITTIINTIYVCFRDWDGGKFSIEKKVASFMVVDVKTHQKATNGQCVMRNCYFTAMWLLTIIPAAIPVLGWLGYIFLLMIYVIDIFMILITKDGRRVGDYIAGTMVVPVEKRQA